MKFKDVPLVAEGDVRLRSSKSRQKIVMDWGGTVNNIESHILLASKDNLARKGKTIKKWG